MAIKDFTEKEIRDKILSKIKPTIISKKAPHWRGRIFLDKKLIGKIKIPNAHSRIMKESKSKRIARDLSLTHKEFNDLIDCPLKGKDYYNKIAELEDKKNKKTY